VAGFPGETAILRPSEGVGFWVIQIANATGFTEYIIIDNLVIDGSTRGTPNTSGTVVRLNAGSRRIRISNSKIIGSYIDQGLGINNGSGILMGDIENEILNNEIYNNRSYGIYTGSIRNIFDGNYIHNNGGYAIQQYSQGHTDNNDNIIRNNILANNGSEHAHCGLLISSGSNTQVYNNVITGSSYCGVQVYPGSVNMKVYNNTIVGNGANCVLNQFGAGGSVIRNNICYNNGGNIADENGDAQVDHNTTNAINPQFVNATSADFHLQSTSPAIDTGLTISIITMDRAEVSRPQGKGYDIGAYEYVGNQLPVPSKLRVISAQ
jgi:hypothetical protein